MCNAMLFQLKNHSRNYFLVLVSFVLINVSLGQDQLSSVSESKLELLNAIPNKKYLKAFGKLSIPEQITKYEELEVFNVFDDYLTSRYQCQVYFLKDTYTEGVRDPIFYVNILYKDPNVMLFLHLSVLEEFHQKGQLLDQLNAYQKDIQKTINKDAYTETEVIPAEIDFEKEFPIFYTPCYDSLNNDWYDAFKPLSSDTLRIWLFDDRIRKIYSFDTYLVDTFLFEQDSEYISNLEIQIENGEDAMFNSLCTFEALRKRGVLKEELDKFFRYRKSQE